ncbi:MAG: hypothetical protein K1X72_04465 [Pyrinomonadaceae bacterium]|nr:hypothetical protein [Pyrinomonadaceae bacterium]
MPIDYTRYPENWHEFSRKIRFERANNCCEKCGVHNHAIGYRIEGKFQLFEDIEEMSLYVAMTIRGENGYSESKALVNDYIFHILEEGETLPIIIVLTVAHLDSIGDICNCEEKTGKKCSIEEHVLALCQKCHLTYDTERHKFNSRRSRAKKVGQPWLADWDARF